ncbi:uncharacterized protein J4E92_003002 [Alternaria infectoria]|uniref:uncharacterized protein n=1 Tax=Alternaria infectoria TaxID=45303 RepID=UPI00221E3F39|nr:uncharacterized protein J4E92_003002 [Alternaria infectoria]KAI4935711.1 hypothetical protein J4E92_003002 [Alternaria infectoria]
MSSRPFRFLDLPAELRCMVYEATDIATRKEKYKPTTRYKPPNVYIKQDDGSSQGNGKLVMYRRALPMSILVTCRLVNKEAAPIIAQKLKTMVREPVRFRMDWTAANRIQNHLNICLNTSPEGALPVIRSSDPRSQFFYTCSSYLAEIARLRPADTASAEVEVTIATSELDYRRMGWSRARTCEFFEGLCQDFGIGPNRGNRWHGGFGVSLRIDAIISPQPTNGLRLDNWRTVVGQPPDYKSYVVHDVSKGEWEEHVQMLKKL